MSEEFWINLSHLISEVRKEKNESFLQLWLENISNPRSFSGGNARNIFSEVRTTCCTSLEIEKRMNSSNEATLTIGEVVLNEMFSEDIDFQYLTQNNTTFLKVMVDESHVFNETQLIALLRCMISRSKYKDSDVQSIRKIVLPNILHGSIELSMEDSEQDDALSIYLCNGNGLVLSKVEEIRFYADRSVEHGTTVDSSCVLFIETYIRNLGYNCDHPDDSFTQIGLDSLEMSQFNIFLMEKYQCEYGITERFPTVALLSEYLQTSLKLSEQITEKKEEKYELSSQQIQLIVMNEMFSSERQQFSEIFSVKLNKSQYDPLTIQRSLMCIIMNQKILRQVYEPSNCIPFMILSGTECFFSGQPQSCLYDHLSINVIEEVSLKFSIKDRNSSEWELFFNFHHIAVDAFSISLIMKNLFSSQNAWSKQYFDCSFEIKDNDLKFWNDTLKISEKIPTEFPRRVPQSAIGELVEVNFPENFSKILFKIRKLTNCSDFSIFASIYLLLTHKSAFLDQLTVGISVSTRRAEASNVIGCFVNTLPLTAKVEPSITISRFVKAVHEQIRAIHDHSTVPFRELIKQNSPNGGFDGMSLFQVLLVQDAMENYEESMLTTSCSNPVMSKYEQTWYFRKTRNSYKLVLEYQKDIFSHNLMVETARKFLFLLKLCSFELESHVSDVSITSESELSLLAQEEFENREDFPHHPVFKHFFENEQSAASFFEFCDERMTYTDIKKSIGLLSSDILQQYVSFYGEFSTVDRLLILICKRNNSLPLYVLSGWLTGFAILPISYDWPFERIVQSVKQFSNCIVITDDSKLRHDLARKHLCIFKRMKHKREAIVCNRICSSDLAYLTFTSGSTGEPKAVCTSFRGHSNLASEYTRILCISSCSVVYQVVNYAFDIFFADLSKILSNGSSCVLAKDRIPSEDELLRCSNAYIMPAYLSSMKNISCLKNYESLHFGGEPIQTNALKSLLSLNIPIFQEYGLTEQTVFSSYKRLRKNSFVSELGTPYHNISIEVRDLDANPLSTYFVGEICLKYMLCRGYYNQKEENEKRFGGGVMKSGDIGQYRNGHLHYLYRFDQRIKINGQIVDLDSLKDFYSNLVGIEACVILPYQQSDNTTQLIAYFITNNDTISESEILEESKKSLAEFMIPKKVCFLDEFPLTSNGKLDKDRLPKPLVEEIQEPEEQLKNDMEIIFMRLVKKYLKKESVSTKHSFFVYGGDSLKALLIIQDLQKFGFSISLKDFLTSENISIISKKIVRLKEHEHSETIDITESQKRIWFLQQLNEGSDAYVIKLHLKGISDKNRMLAAVNTIRMSNFSLRQEFLNEKGTLIVRRLSGTECFLCLWFSSIHLPSARDTITLSFASEELFLFFQHIAVDGQSIAILTQQLSQILNGKLADFQNHSPPQQKQINKEYWEKEFLDYQKGSLIPDRDSHAIQPASYSILRLGMWEKKLLKLSAVENCTVYNILVAAFVECLREILKVSDLVTFMTVSNRHQKNMETVGFFVETLPIRFRSNSCVKAEILSYCKQQVLGLMDNASDPLMKVLDFLKLSPETIRCCITYQTTSSDNFQISDIVVKTILPDHSQFDLSFVFYDSKNGLELRIEYSESFISNKKIRSMEECFLRKLEMFCSDDDYDPWVLPLPSQSTIDIPKAVLRIFQETLESPEVTEQSNFFKIGGNSLLAIKLIYLLEEEFVMSIPLKKIFEFPTPIQIVCYIRENKPKKDGGNVVKKERSSQVSPNQKTLLKSFKLKTNAQMYDIHLRVKFKESFSDNQITRSLNMVIMAHQSLRLMFHLVDGAYQKTLLSGTESYHNPLSLAAGSDKIFSFVKEEDHVFHLQISHLISDGFSFAVILRDFRASFYDSPLQVDDLYDFQSWVSDEFEQKKQKNQDFWSNVLPEEKIFTAFPPNFDRRATTKSVEVPDFQGTLNELSTYYGKTSFHVLMSVLGNVLKRIHGKPMAIAFPQNLRRVKDGNVVDFAINVPIIIADTTGRAEFDIKDTSNRIIEAMDHSFISFDDLLTISRRSHFYDFMLMYDNYSVFSDSMIECQAVEEKFVKCPLTLQVDNLREDKLILVYATSVISSEYVSNFINIFQDVLAEWKLAIFRKSSYNLSYQQKQMFFLSKTKQKNFFVLSFVKKLQCSSETHSVHRRFLEIVQINQQLRTTFSQSRSSVSQIQLSATEVYLSHQTVKTQNIKFFVENFQNSGAVTPQHPICCLFLEYEGSTYAYLVLHHIISDGWTTKLLEKDLICPSLARVHKLSYIDYIQSGRYRQPSEQIPEAYVSRIVSAQSLFGQIPLQEGCCQVQKYVQFPISSGASPFAICLRAISSVIASQYGKRLINIGFPYLNRTRETENIYGFFLVNYVISIEESDTLRAIEEKLAQTIECNYSYMELHKQTKGKVCDIFLNFRYDLEKKEKGMQDVIPIQTHFPLEIDVDKYEKGDLIVLRSSILKRDDLEALNNSITHQIQECTPNKEQHCIPENIEETEVSPKMSSILRLAEKCLRVGREIKAHESFYELGGNSLSFIQFVDSMEVEFELKLNFEKIRLAQSFKEICEIVFPARLKMSEKEDFPSFSSTQAILRNFACYHSSTAFRTGNGATWSYGDVEENVLSIYKQINKLVIEMTGQPIRNDDIIPIISKNSLEVHFWILAVQLTGASYLPILDDTPVKRINQVLSQTPGVSVYLGRCNVEIESKHLNLRKHFYKNFRVHNKNALNDLSYIINTSGTTGHPKGVCIAQKSLIHMMNASTKSFWLNSRDSILQATLFVYDNSVLETWMTSCNGGTLALPSIPCTSKQIHSFILEHKVTICLLFPAFVSILRESTLQLFRHLRFWIAGAEKLPENLLRKALNYDIHVIQNYGPTETTAYALSRLMRIEDNPQNLGRVIQNCNYFVDNNGVLFLSGAGLMRGYLNVQESPFLTEKDRKFYKTGDIVMEQNGNNLIFLGRKDNQVKIRGHRVELSEIETILSQHPEVSQAKLVWDEQNQSLTAFCQTLTSSDNLMKYCKKLLPSHMNPTKISCLERFPLTTNLKIDEEALKGQIHHKSSDFFQTIRNEGYTNFDLSFLHNGGYTLKALELLSKCHNCPKLEHLLSDIPLKDVFKEREVKAPEMTFDLRTVWTEVLGHEMFGENSHFFDVGGNSMVLMKLTNSIQEEFDFIEIDDLLNNLVFNQMRKVLRKKKKNEKEVNFKILQNGSNTERTIVLYHPLYGGCHIYKYIINILLKYLNNVRIICVEHPNSFKIQTTDHCYFNSLNELCFSYYENIKQNLKGKIYLMGASLGGTLAYISSTFIQNSAVIMIDSIATISQCYSFQHHLSNVREYIDDPSMSSFHHILLNSWDLMKMVLNHKHEGASPSQPIYQLSIDGTDLGWNKLCDEVKVIQISGTHSTMLNLINSIELFEILKEIF